MPHLSEAACLLNAGAIYDRRILLEPAAGEPIFAGFKTGAFSIYFGDAPIFHFDLDGRWQRAYIGDVHYLKSLDTSVQAIERVREGENLVLKRRTLGFEETVELDAVVRAKALEMASRIESGSLGRVEPPAKASPITTESLLEILDDIARWDANAWFADRERYLELYQAFPFLPPDALQSAVVVANIGTADGLAFGGSCLSKGPYKALGVDEFERHARKVKAFLGRRIETCRGLFVGGSDLLLENAERLRSIFTVASTVFSIDRTTNTKVDGVSRSFGGIDLFVDRFDEALPDADDWKRYRELGLRRLSIGVQSGSPEVRGDFGKTWKNETLLRLIDDLSRADLRIGLVVLIGSGGEGAFDRHVEATGELIGKSELRAGDLVSLVDGSEINPQREWLSRSRAEDQVEALKAALGPWRTSRKVKVVPFNPEKQGRF